MAREEEQREGYEEGGREGKKDTELYKSKGREGESKPEGQSWGGGSEGFSFTSRKTTEASWEKLYYFMSSLLGVTQSLALPLQLSSSNAPQHTL